MYKLVLLVSISSINVNLSAQDYSAYYFLIEKAKVAIISNDLQLADSLYTMAFKDVLGFSTDYSNAFVNRNRVSNKIDEDFYIKAISTGTTWMDLKYDLKNMGVANFRPYKKTFRKYKPRKKVNGSPIFRLLLKDQLSRSKNFSFLVRKNMDSINAEKLERLFVKKPDLFDRKKTGYFTAEMLNVLLFHQDKWKDAEKLFYLVRENVVQGKIDPSTIQNMIERSSLFAGTIFKIDTIKSKLKISKSTYKLICGKSHFSAIYGNYSRSYDRGANKILLPPKSPEVTNTEINALRKFLFLLNIEEAFPIEKFTFLSEEEYCRILTEKK